MKRETCSYCPGHLVPGKTRFTSTKKGLRLTITHVPADICNRCGMAYFAGPAMLGMEHIEKRVFARKPAAGSRTVRFQTAL